MIDNWTLKLPYFSLNFVINLHETNPWFFNISVKVFTFLQSGVLAMLISSSFSFNDWLAESQFMIFQNLLKLRSTHFEKFMDSTLYSVSALIVKIESNSLLNLHFENPIASRCGNVLMIFRKLDKSKVKLFSSTPTVSFSLMYKMLSTKSQSLHFPALYDHRVNQLELSGYVFCRNVDIKRLKLSFLQVHIITLLKTGHGNWISSVNKLWSFSNITYIWVTEFLKSNRCS